MTSPVPTCDETAPIIEFSDIYTFTVTVPMPSLDQIQKKDGVTYSKIRLASNGVDYGPLLIMFMTVADPLVISPRPLVVIHSRTLFKECKAVTGDLTLVMQTIPRTREDYIRLTLLPLTIFKSPTKYQTVKFIFDFERPQPDLPSDLLQLYRSQDNADVTFSFESKKLKAHKVILGARSDYFRQMFSAGMKENQTGVIEINDFGPDVFEEALIFLYSGFTSKCLDRKLAMLLLPLADKYLIENLKKACIDKIKDHLNVENVSEVLALATALNCAALRDACFRVMKNDMSECKRWEILVEIGDRDLSSEFLKTIDGKKAEAATEK